MQNKFTAEEILAALNQYYKESIFITDGEGNIIFVNEVGAERIGPPREELMYKNVKQLVKEGVYDKSTSLTAIQTKQDAVSALTYRTKNSSISHRIPVLDARGNVEMVVTTNMSMEHNKEWEEIISKERAAMARMQRELDHLRLKGHSRMIAGSPAMQTVMQTIQAIAPTDSNVVIWAKAVRARMSGPDSSTKILCVPTRRLSASTARRSRSSFWNPSFLATRPGHLRAL